MRDNLCKYLVEQYPAAFTQWLLENNSPNVSILKTELNLEPIRADSVAFVQDQEQILHLEFQVEPQTKPPLPLRMLDYWVRLRRTYNCEIVQVLILLKRTTVALPTMFESSTTVHHYRVVKLWEEDPQQFLETPALLPFAVLAQTQNTEELLRTVAARVNQIKPAQERRELGTIVQLMAGLQYKKELIAAIFREELMRESVIYQDILQQGEQKGRLEGRFEGELTVILRLLSRRLGTLPEALQNQIKALTLDNLEALGDALLDFNTLADLELWLRDLA